MSQTVIQNFQVTCLLNSADTWGYQIPRYFEMLPDASFCFESMHEKASWLFFFKKKNTFVPKAGGGLTVGAEAIMTAWLLQLTYFGRKAKMSRV